MLEASVYAKYLDTLRAELVPATGCTEPIAIAYGAALCRRTLGGIPDRVTAKVSGSIVKNVKSVVVPGTGNRKGIEVAVAAGILVGKEDAVLEVLHSAPENTGSLVDAYLKDAEVSVELSDSGLVFDIDLICSLDGDEAQVRIAGHHTNVVLIRRNRAILLREAQDGEEPGNLDVERMNIAEIYRFACECALEDVAPVIERQIRCNVALSDEGLRNPWGACIGKTLLAYSEHPDTLLLAKARAAAGSDARMSGCDLPAVINSGSGNQGVTITLPIVTYAQALESSREDLIRALVLANLCAVRIKKSIGCIGAYCGAICAGCAAGAGIAYLHEQDQSLVEHTIVNGLAILSGTVCDGAKPSCAAKIAMSVEAGVLGFRMAAAGREFVGGDGIVKKGIENTIRGIGRLGRDGMAHTNDVILGIMLEK